MRLQPAAVEMRSIVDDPARREKLRVHLPWLGILALVLRQESGGQALAGFPLLVSSAKLAETLPEALRRAPRQPY